MINRFREDLKNTNMTDTEFESRLEYGHMSKQTFKNKLDKYLVKVIDKKV